jgi:hypothetical protein
MKRKLEGKGERGGEKKLKNRTEDSYPDGVE